MAHRGTTLIEAALLVSIAAMLFASVAPAARRYVDVARVVAAREAFIGLLARARMLALGQGGAVVELSGPPWVATLRSGREAAADTTVYFTRAYGVEVRFSGGDTSEVRFRYDPLGLGAAASRTVIFRRPSGVSRSAVVSAYGRVRRP